MARAKQKQTETDLVGLILEYLETRGHFVWRNNTGAQRWEDKAGRKRMFMFGKKGSPDIVGVARGGQFIGVECKVGKNTLTPEQSAFLGRIRALGGYGIECRRLEDVSNVL